ncbi:MAG: hypothetical protein IKO23_11080 [Bacteroidales bacterium]|nr:hypothetical protein [Bacteroidales bacterium]
MKKTMIILAAFVLALSSGCNNQKNKTAQVAEETEPIVEQTSGIYDITVKDIDGSDVSLASYKGKVLPSVGTSASS